MNDRQTLYTDANVLGADITLANAKTIVLGSWAGAQIWFYLDNGSDAAPTDAPIGTWALWASDTDVTADYHLVPDAATQLAYIAPAGNVLVKRVIRIRGIDAQYARLVYTRTSGGGGDSDITVSATPKGVRESWV